jgi:tetratricopeptide (TPR) repeat protein
VQISGDEAATMMFKAGAISQRYHHFDDSEQRFVTLLDRHCDSEISINAGNAIIDSYVVRGDLTNTREWSEKLAGMECGGEKSDIFKGELKKIVTGVKFEEANLLFEAGEFEAAADRYVALVNEDPDDRNADRALNNAAVAYENIGRFASASATYQRIYTNYELCPAKGSEQLSLAGKEDSGDGKAVAMKAEEGAQQKTAKGKKCSEFADDALLRTGYNHARFFEFEEAVQSYLVLAESKKYEKSEHRLVALENAAGLLDNLQQYERSAELYRKTAAEAEDPSAKAEATFNAARVLSKAGDQRKTIKAFKRFLDRYGRQPDQAERTVESWLRIGKAYKAMGARKNAEDAFRRSISTFHDRGLQVATEAADLPAEAQFLLAEYALADVTDVKLPSKTKALEKASKKLFDRLVTASAEMDKVFPYRRIEWVLAAMYQRAYGFEYVATNVRRAPVPKQLREGTESYYAYKDMIAKAMEPYELKAVGLYQTCVVRSKQYGISNQWTKRARERLNVYLPAEFPLLRDPALDLVVEDRR